MYLIVGLGNPGPRFKRTRHNIGFWVVDNLAGEDKWKKSRKGKALYQWLDKETELLKPQTFMNRSGESVAYAVEKHRLEPSEVIVVHDDASMPPGEMKISINRGGGGHKGVNSIIKALGSESFIRLRVGIGTSRNLKEFVLERFSKEERKVFEDKKQDLLEAVKTIVSEGPEAAMNRFN